MAIAGKVAITLATENNGVWSANATYDRLVAVKHNNNLYISRKANANTEPTTNGEVWFLALEGFSGDDIESIIDGSTQVGNAKTLDGHGAEHFAPKTDLANYLPLTGGTVEGNANVMLGLNSKLSDSNRIVFSYNGSQLGQIGFNGINNPIFMDTGSVIHTLLHTGNKPTGTYTGNGDATERRINTGSIGQVFMIRPKGSSKFAIVTASGYIAKNDSVIETGTSVVESYGKIIISTTSDVFNASGTTYDYVAL